MCLIGVGRMKIAFLFSGQGAQFPGMMNELVENAEAKKVSKLLIAL